MSALDVAPDASFGLRAEQGATPARPPEITDGGEAIWGAAFRQTNSVVSAVQYMRNSGQYTPTPGYNPVTDIKAWGDQRYFLDHGHSFVGSQSPAETLTIKKQIDREEADRKLLSSNGMIGFVAQMGAGMLDPTLLLPGGVAVDAVRGGLTFQKAAISVGKAGLMQTVAQEALLHATQETRTFEESAINVASGTMLAALIGGSAASYLGRTERAAIETKLRDDRAAINEHAGNPEIGEAPIAVDVPANENAPASTGQALAAGAAAADTRQIELVAFGLSEIPGVRKVVEKTSPMQRLFGADSVSARRSAADLAETSLLTKENLEGKVTTAGPALDREARLVINQGQVAVGDELSSLYSEYRFGDQVRAPRAQGFVRDMLGQIAEGKLSYRRVQGRRDGRAPERRHAQYPAGAGRRADDPEQDIRAVEEEGDRSRAAAGRCRR